MSELATLAACPRGHVINYPAVLDDLAAESMDEIAFCAACECGTVHFVVVWAGDQTRLMESGGPELFERFEATGWPGTVHEDANGTFFYRTVSNSLDIAIFQKG